MSEFDQTPQEPEAAPEPAAAAEPAAETPAPAFDQAPPPQYQAPPQGDYQQAPQGEFQQAPPPPQYQAPPQQPGYQQPPYGQQGYQAPPQYGQQYQQGKSKIAAGILGILLGQLGIHNFYLGYKRNAIIQLVLTIVGYCTTVFGIGGFLILIAAIWGLVEGIRILVGSIKVDANGVPLR